MSLDIVDMEKMIETCQAILDSCEKPFVWEEEDTYQYGNYKKPFNLILPHQEIENELLNLFESFSGSSYLYDQITATCTLDEQWVEQGTYGLDRNFGIVFKKYTLKPQYVKLIKTYFNDRLCGLLKSKSEIGQ